MKKIIICSLLTAILALTACGKTETQDNPAEETLPAEVTTTSPETPAEVTTTAPVLKEGADITDDFMKILDGDKIYMEISAVEGDIAVNMTMAVDASDGKDNMYMNADMAGFKIVMLSNEDGSYLIDDATKTYYISDGDDEDMNQELMKTQSYEKTGEGTGTVNGEECKYCEYDIIDADGESNVYKVYYKDGRVIAVGFDGEDTLMMIKNYSSELPEGIFKIPEGYTKQEFSFDMFGE